jgi:hypothetical protein
VNTTCSLDLDFGLQATNLGKRELELTEFGSAKGITHAFGNTTLLEINNPNILTRPFALATLGHHTFHTLHLHHAPHFTEGGAPLFQRLNITLAITDTTDHQTPLLTPALSIRHQVCE